MEEKLVLKNNLKEKSPINQKNPKINYITFFEILLIFFIQI